MFAGRISREMQRMRDQRPRIDRRGFHSTYSGSGQFGLVFSATLIAALGCAGNQHIRVGDIRPIPLGATNPTLSHVDGIRDAAFIGASTNQAVRILAVHGMIENSEGFSQKWQGKIAARFPLAPDTQKTDTIVLDRGYRARVALGTHSPPSFYLDNSVLTISYWVSPTAPRARVIFYELLWAPARDHVKNELLACFESRSLGDEKAKCTEFNSAQPNRDRRDWANGAAKDKLMIRGFADATIVEGPVGDVLEDDVDQAMCLIASDALGYARPTGRCRPASLSALGVPGAAAPERLRLRNTPFLAITHSLGSFLLLDAESRAREERGVLSAEALPFELLNKRVVFMFANQISLLGLGRLRIKCESADSTGCEHVRAASDADTAADATDKTVYVAFNDVNDLLGFELQPYLPLLHSYGGLINVSVRNPAKWRIPWVLKNPGEAHTRQGDNPAIIAAVVDGFDVPTPSRKKYAGTDDAGIHIGNPQWVSVLFGGGVKWKTDPNAIGGISDTYRATGFGEVGLGSWGAGVAVQRAEWLFEIPDWAVQAKFLRTWWRPLGARRNRSFVGVEGEKTLGPFINLQLGLFSRVSGPSRESRFLPTAALTLLR